MKNIFHPPLTLAILAAVLLPAMMNFFQNRSLSRSLTKLDEKVNGLDQKVTKLAPAANDSVIVALGSLREELIKYRAEQVGRDQILGLGSGSSNASDPYANLSMSLDQALATIERQTGAVITPTPTPTRQAKLKSGWKTVDAFEKPQASSKIIGQISEKLSYQILANQDNWYQLGLSANLSGWVQSQFIDETNY